MIPKFRFWDKDEKYFIKEATIVLNKDGSVEGIEYYHTKLGDSVYNDISYYEIMQSTGLFDLDGNEIYIGDILKIEDEYNQVVFHEDNTTYGIYLEDKEGGGNPISDYSTRISLSHIKGIIEGNIYQHPHLLEE